MKTLTQTLSFLLVLLCAGTAWSQTYVTAPLTVPTAAGQFYNGSSITLNPGFSFTASSGSSLQLNIVNIVAPTISYSSGSLTLTTGSAITTLTPTVTGSPVPFSGYTTTFAGNSSHLSVDGTGTAASFNYPNGMGIDSKNNVYITEASGLPAATNNIRKITPLGVVTTIAGSSSTGYVDGTGTGATFHHPVGIAVDASGNVFVADESNNAIRKITPAGVVTTFAGGTSGTADGTGTGAQFNSPTQLVFDASGNLFVSDYNNHRIRKITPAGVVTTFAGSTAGFADGTGTAAQFSNPSGTAIDASGNLYVADKGNNRIRKITPAGVVTTVAGSGTAGFADGAAASAMFNAPHNVVFDAAGNMYVQDYGNNAMRQISPAGEVSTLAGGSTYGTTNGVGYLATFGNSAGGVSNFGIDGFGNLFITDYENTLIRKTVTTPYTIYPALPAGLTFNTTTGVISGTPTAATDSTIAYTITAYNMAGIGTATLNIKVNDNSFGLSNDQNYILTSTPRIPITDQSTLPGQTIANVNKSIQYFDGIDRPMQAIQIGASPLGYDIVQPVAYDPYSRETTKYLPYVPQTGSGGSYRSTAVSTGQPAFYTTPPSGVTAITDPYAQTALETSPLNRPVEQGAPGVPWQLTGVTGGGHTVKMVYKLNNDTSFTGDSLKSRQVARYNANVDSLQNRILVANSYYPAGTLTVTISKDENWVSGRAGTVEEYKDKEGHVVLKRIYNYNGALQVLSTYYIYDDMGELAFVLPPAANGDAATAPTQTVLDNLCYQYRYDERNRPSQKKIPGKGWEYTVFNTIDQPVATQDANQRANNQWIITKYDAMGRPALMQIWNNGGSSIDRATLQSTLTGISTNLWEAPVNTGNGYTTVAWPTTSLTAALTTDFYDTYKNIPSLPTTYTVTTGISNMTRGIATVKKTAVLNTPADQLWDVIYYDDLGRAIQSFAQHYLGGTANTNNYDLSTTTYNFANQPTTASRKHFNTASTTVPLVTIANTFIYDQVGRKLKSWEQITNGSSSPTTKTLISKMDYNEIGQVLNKHLHSTDSTTFLQNIAYTYNERGWMLTSSAPLFAMQLQYNTGTNKAYNGNIMYQLWGTPGSLTKNYAYTYDKLNRILSGSSSAGNNESSIIYDVMGNITALQRTQASTLIDNLAYTYTSSSNVTNQLQSITDATSSDAGLKHGTSSFTYDANGNMITDPTKGASGITIAYNLLNLPQSITGSKTITYTYDATGNKLRRVSTNTGNTDYISGIQYDGTTTSALSFIQTEEGKAVPNGTAYNYTYYLGDNLGNTRITFDTQTGSAVQKQQDDYYPFGMEIAGSVASPKNEYLYNKKELQEELSEYDYGARFYDPVIARWNTIDPLAEISRRWSPYTYVENNPTRLVDPDGMTSDAEWQETQELQQQAYLGSLHKIGAPDNGGDETKPTNPSSKSDTTKSKADTRTRLTPEEQLAIGLRNYGGDYSNDWYDNLLYYTDALNQLNPIAMLWDAVTGAAKGTDRFGNPQSPVETNVNFALAVVPLSELKTPAATLVKDLEIQARELSETLNKGKNSVTIQTVDKQIRYDLVGKAHNGIKTPHVQVYKKNFVNGVVKSITRESKQAKPITQAEIRAIRKYLEKLR